MYKKLLPILLFFFIYVGCPGQLTRTTTIPHSPLDILQAQEQVRHRGGDRRAYRGSNPGRGRNKSHGWSQQLDPQVPILLFLDLFDLFMGVPQKKKKIHTSLRFLSQTNPRMENSHSSKTKNKNKNRKQKTLPPNMDGVCISSLCREEHSF